MKNIILILTFYSVNAWTALEPLKGFHVKHLLNYYNFQDVAGFQTIFPEPTSDGGVFLKRSDMSQPFWSAYRPEGKPNAPQGAGFNFVPIMTLFGKQVSLLNYLGVKIDLDHGIYIPPIDVLNRRIEEINIKGRKDFSGWSDCFEFIKVFGSLSEEDVLRYFAQGKVPIEFDASGRPNFMTVHDISYHFINAFMSNLFKEIIAELQKPKSNVELVNQNLVAHFLDFLTGNLTTHTEAKPYAENTVLSFKNSSIEYFSKFLNPHDKQLLDYQKDFMRNIAEELFRDSLMRMKHLNEIADEITKSKRN